MARFLLNDLSNQGGVAMFTVIENMYIGIAGNGGGTAAG
jgi:hypothetical protein